MELEKLLGTRVYLQLFVKVMEDWRNQGRDLDEMGVTE
jgi:GTPase Era involved in 16S rRNA processing